MCYYKPSERKYDYYCQGYIHFSIEDIQKNNSWPGQSAGTANISSISTTRTKNPNINPR